MRPVPSAIAIDRRWIGAPDTGFSPTVGLFLLTVLGFSAGAAAIASGALPVLPGVLWQALCLYVSFTVLHDAMHGTAHRSKKVGNTMGRVCGAFLLTSLPLFRGVHHAHHGHANDPARDPDMFVAKGPWWVRPLTLAGALLVYRWHFYRGRLWRDDADRREAIVFDVGLIAFLGASVAAGAGPLLVTLWLAPAGIAIVWLAFAFDYLPHYPHTQQGRYYDTRIYPGRLANLLLLGQNYHLIHHLWTTIPWYRYQEVFRAIEPELRERGCAIGWRSRAVAPGTSQRESAAA